MRTIFITFLLFCFSCNHLIKNEEAKVEDEVLNNTLEENKNNTSITEKPLNIKPINKAGDIIGNWVGWFRKKENSEKDYYEDKRDIHAGEGFGWGRENKICLVIEKIEGDNVSGHSVVAGNQRVFKGKISESDTSFLIIANEPGDNKYDGTFNFYANKGDFSINGKWKAFKKIEIQEREYKLSRKNFIYNSAQQLSKESYKRYIDWEKGEKEYKKPKNLTEEEGEEFFRETSEEFVSATEKIYEINASTAELTKADVENLTKGDLLIIRNMIYARHGYSFKNRPLRVFFDAQEWYIPVHTDIKKDLTEIEKKNIQLLLKYEKNAKEYYDYFGRG
ncbi:MAG: YARHG domain-containing protein [Chitinophagales bacterium]|jgi:hypothetical protein